MNLYPKISQFSRLCRTTSLASLHTTPSRLKTFEPDYLESGGEKPPSYPLMNIQLKGYNFDLLENYQSFVHNLVENMGIDVSECWATPSTLWNASIYNIGGTKVKESYALNVYERNVQVANLTSTDAPLLIDLLRSSLPEGVTMSIHEHTDEHYEARFIPDPFIDTLKSELKQLTDKKQEELDKKADKKAKK